MGQIHLAAWLLRCSCSERLLRGFEPSAWAEPPSRRAASRSWQRAPRLETETLRALDDAVAGGRGSSFFFPRCITLWLHFQLS